MDEGNIFYEARAVSKRGCRQGRWCTLKRFYEEQEAWNYARSNRNLLGLVEVWRVSCYNDRARGDAGVEAEALHSVHHADTNRIKPVTIVG